MIKSHLVTKETMEYCYDEEIEIDLILNGLQNTFNTIHHPIHDTKEKRFKGSVGDDLESFFMFLRKGIIKSNARTFFLPKILPFERKMIEDRSEGKNINRSKYCELPELLWVPLASVWKCSGDVNKVEMDLSESNSKYTFCFCARQTHRLRSRV